MTGSRAIVAVVRSTRRPESQCIAPAEVSIRRSWAARTTKRNLRAIAIGIAGASASGKTTVLRSLLSLLGTRNAAHLDLDGYHRHSREERARLREYPEDPSANDLKRAAADLCALLAGRAILMPVYDHRKGILAEPRRLAPKIVVFLEGLHSGLLSSGPRRRLVDYTIFVCPSEDLRRAWKVNRDVNQRGYSYAEATSQIAQREPYVAKYVRPQKDAASVVVSVEQRRDGGMAHRVLVSPSFCRALVALRSTSGHRWRRVLCSRRSSHNGRNYVEVHLAKGSEKAINSLRAALSSLELSIAAHRLTGADVRYSYNEAIHVLYALVLLSIARRMVR